MIADDGRANESHQPYVVENTNITSLNNSFILERSSTLLTTGQRGFFDVRPLRIEVNYGEFDHPGKPGFPAVTVDQRDSALRLQCTCGASNRTLCEHQSQVLYNLFNRKELRFFFDEKVRTELLTQKAKDYGLPGGRPAEDFFQWEFTPEGLQILAKTPGFLSVTPSSRSAIRQQLLPVTKPFFPKEPALETGSRRILVLSRHRHSEYLQVTLLETRMTKDGKVRNPITPLNPLGEVWTTDRPEELRFYAGVSHFQVNYRGHTVEQDVRALQSIVKNPTGLPCFYHKATVGENITAQSLAPIHLQEPETNLILQVTFRDEYYEINGEILIGGVKYSLDTVSIRFTYFLNTPDTFNLISNPNFLAAINFLKKYHNRVLIYQTQYEEFQKEVLAPLEDRVHIQYSYLRPATKKQRTENGFDTPPERLVYLTENENFIHFTPVMRYGNAEVPVKSKKQIHAIDRNGTPFTVDRDDDAEIQLYVILMNQHPFFFEQHELDNVNVEINGFYLHKKRFLEDDWFLNAFESLRNENVSILGFNKISGHRFNTHQAKVNIQVISGLSWFDTTVNMRFGRQKVGLKHLRQALKNRTRYVVLDDGTQGIIPAEWLAKLSGYFALGHVSGEYIRTPKMQFADVDDAYEQEVLSLEVKQEIAYLNERFANFDEIPEAPCPAGLATTLRVYQQDGLNWLNFLDDFAFGGCLADDMGLGKTIQIIAFILLLKEKRKPDAHLIVVPTSLVFNWEAEIQKFAPELRILIFHGPERRKSTPQIKDYDVVLTTYGTLVSDINSLKKLNFDYIFLDESQAIKNPESQRYKAACELRSRNKIVMTGTPVENNTFDLYGQLSFACPGLLGNKQHFREQYAVPIDQFKDMRRSAVLRKKVHPFILRRTKQQVATELPDKTEMVVYCELGEEQRKVYNAYEAEFRNFINTRQELDLSRDSMHILQGITKLRQICNSPALLNDDFYYGNASAKIEVLIEQIEEKSGQHKILVFSQFVSMLDLIRKELTQKKIPFEYLTGATRDRGTRVGNFSSNDDVRVFLISLKAGGTGLNLTEADYVYLVDPWWNPAIENQAIDRSYRIGQKKNVMAIRLIAPDTIEERIMVLQKSKKRLVDDLIRTDTDFFKSLTRTDLLSLL